MFTLEVHEMYEVSGDGWVSSILEVIVYAEEISTPTRSTK